MNPISASNTSPTPHWRSRWARVLPLILVLCCLPSVVQAQMTFCNQGNSRVFSAVGYKLDGDWTSEGWYVLDPNQCKVVVGGELQNRYYYVFGKSPGTSTTYKGDYPFCVHQTEAFTARGDTNCAARSFESVGFDQIDTGDHRSFTFNFIDSSTPLPPPVRPDSRPDICSNIRMGLASYRIVVKTGTPSGAGTDSTISLNLVGNPSSCSNSTESGWIDLNSRSDQSNAFENDGVDTIEAEGPGLSVTGIQLQSDGRWSGSAWFCDWIEVNGTRFNVRSWIEYGKVYNFRAN